MTTPSLRTVGKMRMHFSMTWRNTQLMGEQKEMVRGWKMVKSLAIPEN